MAGQGMAARRRLRQPMADTVSPVQAVDDVLLEIRGLRAWYGPSQALHGIDLDVREGELVTLLGRNGAGKSTVLKAVMAAGDFHCQEVHQSWLAVP